MEFFDSHSHYNDEKFDIDREEIIKKTFEAGITKMIVAGYNIESSKQAIQIANENSWIYAICGISPNDVTQNEDEHVEEIKKLCLSCKKVVAVGEIGLDYYWNKENKEVQKSFFKKQIKLANELSLPIVIHSRDAFVDTIEILKEEPCDKKGIFHCCQQNIELVKQALDLGYYISLAGPYTFKNAKNADEIIKLIPEDKILIETDSPYLSPEPLRGTRNDSRNVIEVAKKIAIVKGVSLDEVAKKTFNNAQKIFGIK